MICATPAGWALKDNVDTSDDGPKPVFIYFIQQPTNIDIVFPGTGLTTGNGKGYGITGYEPHQSFTVCEPLRSWRRRRQWINQRSHYCQITDMGSKINVSCLSPTDSSEWFILLHSSDWQETQTEGVIIAPCFNMHGRFFLFYSCCVSQMTSKLFNFKAGEVKPITNNLFILI